MMATPALRRFKMIWGPPRPIFLSTPVRCIVFNKETDFNTFIVDFLLSQVNFLRTVVSPQSASLRNFVKLLMAMSLSKARASASSPSTTLDIAELLTTKSSICSNNTSSFTSSAFDHALAQRAPARAIVNLAALRHNARVLRGAAADLNAQVMAVVKADAYGHGAVPAVEAMAQSGVRAFAVATLSEAVELRKGLTNQGKPISILVLGAPSTDDLPFMLHFDLEAMVTSVEVARHLAEALSNGTDCTTRLRVHICRGRVRWIRAADRFFWGQIDIDDLSSI